MRAFTLLPLGLVALSVASEGPILRAQHPSLSPDGSQVAFSWQGDLWVVASRGGEARRLTVHPARDQMPIWSPDGKTIAFASDRFGSMDLFALDGRGSEPRRLTFESASELPSAWSRDGRRLLGYTNAWGVFDAFAVPATGGDLKRLSVHPLERSYWPEEMPNGQILHVRGGSPGGWRNGSLRSTNTGDLWLAGNTVPLSGHRRLTDDDAQDLFPRAASDGSITWVSNRGGWSNLWRMKADGSGARALTRFTSGTVRFPSISAEGRWVVYEHASTLRLLDTRSGQDRILEITVSRDSRSNPIQRTTLTSGVTSFSISPDGRRHAVEVRGDIFLVAERGGTTRRLTEHPARDAQPVWLDDKSVLYVTGRAGKREIWRSDLAGEESPWKAEAGDLTSPAVSPDGKQVAFVRGGKELMVAGADGTGTRTLARGNFMDALFSPAKMNWSPDSKWIAIQSTYEAMFEHLLVEVATGRTIVAARCVYRPNSDASSAPVWLPDGRGIAFIGQETREPEVYVVDLLPAPLTFGEDDLEPAGKKEDKAPVEVRVVEEGLLQRMRQLTSGGASGVAVSEDSKTIYTIFNGQLSSVPVAGGPVAPLAGGPSSASGLRRGPGNRLFFVSQGRLGAVPVAGGAVSTVAFSAEVTFDNRAEQEALFDEIGWAFDRGFYDTTFHGRRWPEIRERYRALLPHAFDRADFYALMDEMMHELGSSHLNSSPPSVSLGVEPDQTAYLGVEWDWRALGDGRFVVAEVVTGMPAAHPDSRLQPGDVLRKVDGREIGRETTLAAALDRKAGRRVTLTLDRGGQPVTVIIKPAEPGARTDAQYEAWVRRNRAEVDRLSGGRLAYLHYRRMHPDAQERFVREIRTMTRGKQGVIIDVRFNGGGATAHEALGLLIKTPWLKRTERGLPNTPISENIYRGDALELPTTMIINGASFSNAEIFAEGFRRLGLGRIVGIATAGGVIGTAQYSMWDGGLIGLPAIGAFAIDGENLEGNGRRPDVKVDWDPDRWLAGHDTQIEAAVRVMLEGLGKR